MRIISKESDYYDCGLQYGIDEDLTYIREKNVIELNLPEYTEKNFFNEGDYDDIFIYNFFKNNPNKLDFSDFYFSLNHSKYNMRELYIYSYIIGFCGELIPAFKVCGKNIEQVFYNVNELLFFLESFNIKFSEFNIDRLNNFNKNKDLEFIFRLFNTPVFSLNNKKIIINDNLKSLNFKEFVNPYECFQKISMYIGFLNSPEEDVKMEDSIIRDSKGFNDCSFKKRSDKRGRKCTKKN